jgi:hypothetical protein
MSTICLGMFLGLLHLGMAGWGCIYSPQHKSSRWRKVVLSAAHRTVRWCTGQCTVQCPVRLVIGLTLQPTVGMQAFYTGHLGCHTGQSGGLLSTVPPETSRWGYCSLVHRTVQCSRLDSPQATLPLFLGLHLIFIMSSFEVLLSSMSWSK